MHPARRIPHAALTAYEAYRLRCFSGCGLHDVAAISAGLRRLSEQRKAKARHERNRREAA